MSLHIPTLMLALLLGFLLLTLELGVSLRRLRGRPDMRSWMAGCWALLLGFAGLAARGVLPLWLSILLGNGLIALGIAFYSRALHQFLDRPVPLWLMGSQPLVWLATLAMLDWPLNQRTALLSVANAVMLAPGVWLLLRHGWRAEHSLRTVALTMGAAGIALLVRAVHAWLEPSAYTDLMQASLGQGLTFLMAFMCLIGAGFGFVLALFERVAQRMEDLATYDGLTGCVNRSTTDAMLAHALQLGQREATTLAFVLMDLDHFKQVNDRHGHRAGDQVLRCFARTVRERLRASDVFGRTGGEEFALILPATDRAGAQHLVEDVRRAVEAMSVGHATDSAAPTMLAVTMSAGIAVATPDSALSGDKLYGLADAALYGAKRAGRNRVQVYELGLTPVLSSKCGSATLPEPPRGAGWAQPGPGGAQ